MEVRLHVIPQSLIWNGERNLLPEEHMIYEARVSSPDNRVNHETAPKLLKYLITHGHWSPFEMISFGFQIKTSRAIAQQIIRHRSFSFQEYSQRYAEAVDLEPVELRKNGATNRQSSTEVCDDPELQGKLDAALVHSYTTYRELLNKGIAKETARMVLPLTTQTTIVMHGTLRSWIHFFDQRCSEHAQKEIQDIALEIRRQLAQYCPWTARALNW